MMAKSTGLAKLGEKAAMKAAIISMKKGKTNDQKDIIDFFMTDKKKGCLNFFGKSTMTIDQYIEKVQARVRQLNLKEKGLEMLGLDVSQVGLTDPICLYDFIYDDDEAFLKFEDNKLVSSIYDVTWLYFSQNQVYVYSCTFDMTSDDMTEYTKEYFYRDITCFEVESELVEKIDISIAQGCGCLGGEKIAKNNYSINRLKITVPGSSTFMAMRNQGSQKASIFGARHLIREMKNPEKQDK